MPVTASHTITNRNTFSIQDREINLDDLQFILVDLISQIIDSTNTIEIAKKTLESNPCFDVYALFLYLDQEGKGYLDVSNMNEYVNHTYVNRSLDGIEYMNMAYLFHLFRPSNPLEINFSEFASSILPDDFSKLLRPTDKFCDGKHYMDKGRVYT
jgi:hypothetical protein